MIETRLGNGATFSTDRAYRYHLSRSLDAYWLPPIAWVMLNPSTADETTNDPTIRKVLGFSTRWGFGRVEVYNLFAHRSTDPEELEAVEDPIGDNLLYLRAIPEEIEVIAAWGAWLPKGHDDYLNEVWKVLLARKTCCIGRTGNGEPRHPVRAGYDSNRERWTR
ncbi:MAG: DUF1643 domain-containing protein [Mycobacteriales bacterium]